MKMRAVVAEIKRNGVMSGFDVSYYSRNTLGLEKKAAGGCLSQAHRRGLIAIVGTRWVNGTEYNLYS